MLYTDAGGHSEGGGDGGEYGDDDVQDFAPKFFFHSLLIYGLWFMMFVYDV